MKKTVTFTFILLTLISGCQNNSINNINSFYKKNLENKMISGKVLFPSFNTKATISQVGSGATVSLIYPNDNINSPNLTIATGLTDVNGNFQINPSSSFNPSPNTGEDIFILEAIKRIGSAGNDILTLRTYIKWNGSQWVSITTNGIWINSKTSAVTVIDSYRNDISSNDCLGKVDTSGVEPIALNIGTIQASEINEVSDTITNLLSNNTDPTRHIDYKNNVFTIITPTNPAFNYLIETNRCPECDLKNESLDNKNFTNANLKRANLRKANLSSSNFSGANLVEVDLNQANISSTNFSGADLSKAIWIDGITCSSGSIGQCIQPIYVNDSATGLNNGTSWANAYTNLQSALSSATSGKEIWVKAGTYKPTTGTDQNATFQLKSGVKIYGGFLGTETGLTERNTTLNTTILSGDIGSTNVTSDNTYHVVTGISNSTIDGFTITGGNAISGILNGGGMYNINASPTITNCTFSNNSASNSGGAIYNHSSSPKISNSTFSNNSASTSGGAIYNLGSQPELTDITFSNNSANLGGAIYNNSFITTMKKLRFYGNTSSGIGSGGAIYNTNSNYQIINSIFYNNIATYSGGAISNASAVTLTVINSTFSNNSAGLGKSIYNVPNISGLTIKNSILYDLGGILNETSGGLIPSVKIGYTNLRGGFSGGYNGGNIRDLNNNIIINDTQFNIAGNINADPLFINTSGSNFLSIPSNSTSKNAGTNTGSPTDDINGVSRPKGGTTDMGAYEYIE